MATPSASTPASSLQITLRTDQALGTKFLQSVLKPFGNSLVKPGKPVPPGSPELTPHESIYKHCNVRQREVQGIRIYDINARSKHTKSMFTDVNGYNKGEYEARQAAKIENKDPLSLDPTPSHNGHDIRSHDFARTHSGRRRHRHIYYFAGGGWQSSPSKEHWKLCSFLARRGTGGDTRTTVSIVSYPLAPHCPFAMSFPKLELLYTEIMGGMVSCEEEEEEWGRRSATVHSDEIILAGDSAGGNVALALTQKMLSNYNTPAPHSLLLISPAVDLRNVNPEQSAVEKKDPILTMPFINSTAKAWCSSGVLPDSENVSPLLGNFDEFVKRNVAINGVVGLYDILAPDVILLTKKLMDVGVKGRWLEWDKQMHCFPLAFSYGLSEGKEAVQWIIELLNTPQT